MSQRAYQSKLRDVVGSVFDATDRLGFSWAQLATEAGVCPATVYNLGNRKTRFPQFRTLYVLAYAVGLEWRLVEPMKSNPRLKIRRA